MNVFRVIEKLQIGNVYCVTVMGDISLLKNGLKLIDEKQNRFAIETVAMSRYHNLEDYKKYAEIVLCGDIENIGETLFIDGKKK